MNAGRAERRPGVYTALIACAYVGVAGITTVYSLLSTLYRQFDDPVRIGWVVSVYYLVSAVFSAICGRFGDLLGRKRMVLAVLPVAAAGAFISANSSTLNSVIAGCAIQGVAGALTPLALGIAREALPAAKIPFAVGVVMAALVAGGGLSFWVAGTVIDHYSWSGAFYMKVVLAAIAIVAVLRFIPDRRARGGIPGRVNVPVGILFAPAIAGFFIAAQLAVSLGWSHKAVIATLLSSAALLAYWARHQAREPCPLIDVRMLLNRQVFLANLCFAFLCLGCMQNGQVLSLFLQQPLWTRTGFGLTASVSGAMLLCLLSTAFVSGPMGGVLTARCGARQVVLLGFILGAVGWSVNAAFHRSLWLFLGMCMLGTLCVSLGQTAAYTLIIQATPEERTSEAVGLTHVLLSVFMAIGAQAITALLATTRISKASAAIGTFPSDQAYTLTFAYIAAMSLLGVGTALALKRRGASAAVTSAFPGESAHAHS